MSTCGKIPTLCRNSDDDMRAIFFARRAACFFSLRCVAPSWKKTTKFVNHGHRHAALFALKSARRASRKSVRAGTTGHARMPSFAASIRRHCVSWCTSRAVPARRVDDDLAVCDIASCAVLQTYWSCARCVCIRLPGSQFEPAMRAAALKKIDAEKIFSRRINALRMDVAVMRPVAHGVVWACANTSRRRLRVRDGAAAS